MHGTIYCIKYNAEYSQIIKIDEKCIKHKICFFFLTILGEFISSYLYIFVCTCTVNNRKTESLTKRNEYF